MDNENTVIQSIIEAARKLMQQYGFSKTTMEDIAKAAGKGKSTLYHHFKNKEEIIDEVLGQEMDSFFREVKQAVDQEKSLHAKLKTYIVVKIQSIRHRVNLYRFAMETDASTLEINTQFRRLRTRYDQQEANLILSVLTLGIAEGTLHHQSEADLAMLTELLVTCVRGVEMDIIMYNKHNTLPDKADLLVGVLVKGLS
ncbi:TetR/AcrR family transcriptional regulator [Arsenicibacter rosenii]|uniref:HTH tetR-type domain-containing protein n=1 Tax=Arsenicibacter rosenii TaxID=1750698 RepID=A0A1S2VB99_9BACT|nr:TetR/AcrR family transcriptional regulator [Arsenicibacter rosenii]OIN56027.1 hypothetical protein BLX24_27165 [Arsenicibacter rosenii]